MKYTIWNVLGSTVLLMLGPARLSWALTAQPIEQVPQITVRVYNYAKVPGGAMQEAKDIAAGIFEEVAVELTWLDCFSPNGNAGMDPSCQQPPTARAINLRLAGRPAIPEVFECGIAIPVGEGGFSKRAIVFHDCVEKLAVAEGSTRVAVLGHIIAHEIGHLLLGLGSHSTRGIMRYPWGRREIELADKGWLRFTARQGEQIRGQVRARNRADHALSNN